MKTICNYIRRANQLCRVGSFFESEPPGQASWPFPCNRTNRVNAGLTRSTRMRFDNHSTNKMAAIQSGKKLSWTAKLVENLIKSLSDFETRMEFMNKYFNGDKPRQYEEIRKEMALYCSINIKMFRPEQGRR